MNRSLSLLSALALGSTSLVIANAPQAEAMTIAYDCFDRTTSALVARSSVDMTSPAVSCLPVPGAAAVDTTPLETADDVVLEAGVTEELTPDLTTEQEMTIEDQLGSAVGQAVGQHLGQLLEQGIADLFR